MSQSGIPVSVSNTGTFPLVFLTAALTTIGLFCPLPSEIGNCTPPGQVENSPIQTEVRPDSSLPETEATPRPIRMKVGPCQIDIKAADSGQGCDMTVTDYGTGKILLQRHFDHVVQFLARNPTEGGREQVDQAEQVEPKNARELALTPGDKCGGPLKHSRLAFGLFEEATGRYYVYSVNPDVKELFTMDKISSLAIARIGGRDEFFVADLYPDWGAIAVSPRMVLYWDESLGKLRLDTSITPDLSRLSMLDEQYKDLPALDDEDIMAMAPPELAEQTLNILYCGQYKQARDFFNRNWPPQRRGRLAYWKMLTAKAKASSLWQYVREVTN